MGNSEGSDGQRYDVIVVGSGSAGAVVARRLVDRGDVRVLLLEAGGTDTNPAIHDPARLHELWDTSDDWAIRTTPQLHAAERQLQWPRGRVLGGSSAMNGMIWVRGNPADYDMWAYAGNPGWTWADCKPIFEEIETFMEVRKDERPDPFYQAVIDAAVDAGIPFNPDYNGESQLGISSMQYVIKDGRRNSTARAYLGAVLDHPNLTILTESVARKLLFERDRCIGVEYERAGATERAYAEGEVVVSGGTIGSPGLLLASGIGPADELRALGIEVVADLPGVGHNLHDHLMSPVIYSSKEIPPARSGVPFMQTHLFAKSDPGLLVPDLQPLHFDIPMYEPWMEPVSPTGFTLMAGMVRPQSRGTIKLAGPDPSDGLLIDPHALEAQADVDMLLAGIDIMRSIGRSPYLADGWNAVELYPGPGVTSVEALTNYVRRTAITYHHQVGTCKMGVDVEAVVNPKLAVHGVLGLRVADASIMPAVTTGNTHAPTVMIGERAAQWIGEALSAAPGRPAAATA
jgi:choline dehydrogenase